MGISFTDFTGGSAKQNNFSINTGASGNNVFTLDRTYDAGFYVMTFTSSDTTYDVYAVASSGDYAGYTNQSIIEITEKFNKIVILGAEVNDQIFFEYRGTSNAPAESGTQPGAGPYISSVVTSSLPNIDDTTVVNGGNFATNVEIYFIGQDTSESAAKSVVRNTATQLIVTRPDSFTPDNSPYTLKAVNPGIPSPSATESNLLSNSVTAGTNPTWVTGTTVLYNISAASSITLEATDTEGSDIDYSIVAGTLPAGLSLDEETGVVSGTFSGSANEGDVTSVTIRAIDAGGNFLDKAFDFTANASPIWTTAAGSLGNAIADANYSYQLAASTGSLGGALTYSISAGNVPGGTTLSSSGLISGTPNTEETANFTVRVTDAEGAFAERAFSIEVTTAIFVNYLVIAGGGGGGGTNNGGPTGGGGGAGGYRSSVSGELSGRGASAETVLPVDAGVNYTVTVGAGASGSAYNVFANGPQGSPSTFATITSTGGGPGGFGTQNNGAGFPGGSGGSGGGGASAGNGAGAAGAGTTGQGYDGGVGFNQNGAAGGGGAGGIGDNGGTLNGGNGGIGVASSITGESVYRAGGGGGGSIGGYVTSLGGLGGGGAGSPGQNYRPPAAGMPNTGGGGGGTRVLPYATGANGGSGVVILRYAASVDITVGAGLTSYTLTDGIERVTVFTAGTGNVSFAGASAQVEQVGFLAVAGGGGAGTTPLAGNQRAGGGGAGGLVTSSDWGLLLTHSQSYPVSIGAGGAGATSANTVAGNGTNTNIGGLVLHGGGGGNGFGNANEGGSGGGAGPDSVDRPGRGIPGQGFDGSFGAYNSNGGAGGGASENGGTDGAGHGGDGVITTLVTTAVATSTSVGQVVGSDVYLGGGGGGTNGTQGLGGGGNQYGASGTANTGGGGAGNWSGGSGGSGGSGAIILRYPSTRTLSVSAGLSSTTQTIGSDKVTLIKGGTGTISIS